MTEHPGEQFPPDVDPDVEPGFDPYPSEETPQAPDYDAEPAPQNVTPDQPHATTASQSYGGDAEEVDTEAAFEASLGEVSAAEAHTEPGGEPVGGHVDPAEVEFGPEFARAPGEEHEHSFVAESAAGEDVADEERAHPLVEETMGRLDELRDRPVGEHAEVYADLHERLQSALVEADADPGDPG